MNAHGTSRAFLEVSVAQICKLQGWTAITPSAKEVLVDLVENKIETIAKLTHKVTELYGRTESNLDDLGLAFELDRMDIGELQNYVQNADQAPFPHEPIAFPAPKADTLQIPKPNSLEVLHHREEHIHSHLPPMYPSMEESGDQTPSSTLPAMPRETGAETGAPNSTAPPATADNRTAAPSSLDPLVPGKRSRITPFSLPEEARPSQYEMSSVIMAADGTILGLNGRGKLPDPGPPPPTIRLGVSEPDSSSNTSKRGEGSETNADADTASKEAATRASSATGKEGSAAGSGNKSKSESSKAKSKKKERAGGEEKEKKAKKTDKEVSDKKLKVTVGGKRPFSAEQGSTPAAKKPKLKEGKTPEGKSKTSLKVAKIKEKAESKRKSTSLGKSLSSCAVSEKGSESCLKDLLLSSDSLAPAAHSEQAPSASSGAHKSELTSPTPADSEMLRQAFLSTDNFDSGSGETSPQRLVINEAEGRAQEREEEKRIRLKNIDDTISSVIKDSAANFSSEKPEAKTVENPVPPVLPPAEPPRKRGRPKKIKAKDKIKSSEFIADDVISQEKAEEMGARSMKSITDTIDAVIRQGSEEPKPPLPKQESVESSSIPPAVPSAPPVPHPPRPVGKESRKRKAEKDKAPAVKKKLKAKLQHKTEKDSEVAPSQTAVDSKPFVSDKFSKAEMDVFDFAESESPPPMPERRPSQAEKEPSPSEAAAALPMSVPVTLSGIKPAPMSVPVTLSGIKPAPSSSSVDVKPVVKSPPTPEAAAAAGPASPLSSPPAPSGGEQQPLLPLKIGIPREKDRERHKEKSRDKDYHRKDKKEKRRDKEKKKKNRDRNRDKGPRLKHRRMESESGDECTTLKGLKLKIRFGKESFLSKPLLKAYVPSQKDKELTAKGEEEEEDHPPPSQHEGLKLLIRQDTGEGPSSQKKYSSVVSTPAHKPGPATSRSRSEPRNSPPVLHPPSPLPESPPLPVLSPEGERSPSLPASSPPAAAAGGEGEGGSPASHKSPPPHGHHSSFSFSSRHSSPQRGRRSLSPPPRTPSFSPKSPSPMPKTPPSPKQFGYPSSPVSFSSPFHPSPVGHKSPTPTPKTPSLSPAYNFPDQADSPSLRQEKYAGPLRRLFGSPKQDTAPPSPPAPPPPVALKTDTPPPPVVPKPKGKVGRPRLNPPKAPAAKRKSPKAAGKAKPGKAGGTGKSAGRGRPPKAKNLALMAALVDKSSDSPPAKPNPKPLTPPPLETKKESPAKTPASGLDIEVDKSGHDSDSDSPSPTQLSVALPPSSSKQRGTVETETVGSFIDSETGVQVWYCPSCKQQDDGTPMIGCDKCDDWHHWVCVNITKEPPEEEPWFCPRCSSARGRRPSAKGKRGRKKKIH